MAFKSKKIETLILALGLGMLFSCNSSKAEENSQLSRNLPTEANIIDEPTVVQESLELMGQPNTSSNWQIDDYVAHLVGEKIAFDARNLNQNDSVQWYYQTLDVKGGFASITGAIDGWHEYVVWRMADGDDLVGKMAVSCGPACDYTFTFYKGKNTEIEELDLERILPIAEIEAHRKKMLPKITIKYPVDYPEDSQVIYNLPQKGTGMRVDLAVGADEVTVPILKLGWNKSNFFIEELFEKVEESSD